MLSFLENKSWFKGSKSIGLHLQLSGSKKQYTLCQLQSEKGKVVLKEKREFQEISEKETNDFKGLPIYLTLDGKGIMHVRRKKNEEVLDTLNRILPNAKPKDFYLQEYGDTNNQWLSLIRIDLLHEITNQLISKNLAIINLTLGAFPLENINRFGMSVEKENDFHLHDKKWSVRSDEIKQIDKVEEITTHKEIRLDKDTILQKQFILPFLNGIRFFVQRSSIQSEPFKVISENHSNFFHQRLFKVAGWAALGFFFSILLINFLLFENYQKDTQLLEAELTQKKQLIDRWEELKLKVDQKQSFLQASGLIEGAKISFKVDRLAAEIPSSINLLNLAVNPIKKKDYGKNETPDFLWNEVHLEGLVTESVALNNWIKKMKAKEWIIAVEIDSYEFIKKKKAGLFKVIITTK